MATMKPTQPIFNASWSERHNALEYKAAGAEYTSIADPMLLIIRAAWDNGMDFEGEADGFGPGLGTNGDWSAIRDSTDEAKARMFAKAYNAIAFLI